MSPALKGTCTVSQNVTSGLTVSMVAPRDYFQDDKEASGILKIIES